MPKLDYGQYERVSEAGVFQNSVIFNLLDRDPLNMPKEYFKISISNEQRPFVIVGDEAFPLKTYLMRPFAARTLNEHIDFSTTTDIPEPEGASNALLVLWPKSSRFFNAPSTSNQVKQLLLLMQARFFTTISDDRMDGRLITRNLFNMRYFWLHQIFFIIFNLYMVKGLLAIKLAWETQSQNFSVVHMGVWNSKTNKSSEIYDEAPLPR